MGGGVRRRLNQDPPCENKTTGRSGKLGGRNVEQLNTSRNELIKIAETVLSPVKPDKHPSARRLSKIQRYALSPKDEILLQKLSAINQQSSSSTNSPSYKEELTSFSESYFSQVGSRGRKKNSFTHKGKYTTLLQRKKEKRSIPIRKYF